LKQIFINDREIRKAQRSRDAYERCLRGGYRNAIFNGVKNRALDGQAFKFNTPIPYKDSVIMFLPDTFGDVEDHVVAFCLDHELDTEVASTNDGLQLIVDDDAIRFRLNLERAKRGDVLARLCEIGNREAISIGFNILDEHTKTIAGHDVRIVTSARLVEISLLKAGAAGDNAFAFLVDTTVTPKPVAGARSTMFNLGQKLFSVSRKVRNMKATNTAVLALQDRLALLGGEPALLSRTMTIDRSNHLQSLYIQRLQTEQRAVLGM
jgi:HK97 family phage prohead protease